MGWATRPTDIEQESMCYYKRKLPHWQPPGAEYFITTRLYGTLPGSAVERLRKLREDYKARGLHNSLDLGTRIQWKIFDKYEALIDKQSVGPKWLANKKISEIVASSIHYRNRKQYDLYAFCIMSNHIHLVFRHLMSENDKLYPVTDIMRKFKRYTARECNKVLKRSGPFWQPESYDRVIRNSNELEHTIRYTLNNPVKAGLVEQWKDWSYSYCKPEWVADFGIS